MPDGNFQLDNIPVFARDVSLGDIVSAENNAGRLRFRTVVQNGGHSTVRILLPTSGNGQALLKPLQDLGCTVRESRVNGLFAIDVPPQVDYGAVTDILEAGEREGVWDYEQSSIAGSADRNGA
jgi:hypothetical protein